jgi:hypothetical protein
MNEVIRCRECNRIKISGNRKVMTPKEFKATFKIGDVICGYSTNKRVKITAIGEERFMYVSVDCASEKGKERVAKMSVATGWAKSK